jgi:hypothetical protein
VLLNLAIANEQIVRGKNKNIRQMEVKLTNGNVLEIKDEDYELPLSLNKALKLCESIEGNWRLPTVQEFEFFNEHLFKNGIGNFKEDSYWTSTNENGNWTFNFQIGAAYNGYYM